MTLMKLMLIGILMSATLAWADKCDDVFTQFPTRAEYQSMQTTYGYWAAGCVGVLTIMKCDIYNALAKSTKCQDFLDAQWINYQQMGRNCGNTRTNLPDQDRTAKVQVSFCKKYDKFLKDTNKTAINDSGRSNDKDDLADVLPSSDVSKALGE